MKNPIIVPLDLDDPTRARQLVEQLQPHVGGFKVGPRLTFRVDRGFLKDLSQSGILFFDHKFFDIPSTTVSAVEVAAEMGAHWVTVHGLNGPQCLKDLRALEKKIQKTRQEFRVLAVTLLTSFNSETLPTVLKNQSIAMNVESLAHDAKQADIHSLVCSPEEIQMLRKIYPDSFLVVPGVRPEGASLQDQTRVATPQKAMQLGASALIIGRPIIEHANPAEAARNILSSLT